MYCHVAIHIHIVGFRVTLLLITRSYVQNLAPEHSDYQDFRCTIKFK